MLRVVPLSVTFTFWVEIVTHHIYQRYFSMTQINDLHLRIRKIAIANLKKESLVASIQLPAKPDKRYLVGARLANRDHPSPLLVKISTLPIELKSPPPPLKWT